MDANEICRLVETKMWNALEAGDRQTYFVLSEVLGLVEDYAADIDELKDVIAENGDQAALGAIPLIQDDNAGIPTG